jgi:hypothetical protein
MRDSAYLAPEATLELRPPGAEESARDLTRDTKAFLAAVRSRIFTFLRSLVSGDAVQALATLSSNEDRDGAVWTPERLQASLEAYLADHERLCLDPNARNLRHTHLPKPISEGTWLVDQVLVDPEEHCDWVAQFEVDLAASRERGEPVLHLTKLGPMG